MYFGESRSLQSLHCNHLIGIFYGYSYECSFISTQSAAAGASRNSQHSVSCCRCKQKQPALSQLLQVQAETVSTQSAAAGASRNSQHSVSSCKCTQRQSAFSQQVQAETVSTQSAAASASRNSQHSVSCCK